MAVEDRAGHSVLTFIGRSARGIEARAALAAALAVVALAGCGGGGSSDSSPSPTASPPGGNAVPVSVVITEDDVTANVRQLSVGKGAVLQIRNTSSRAAEVVLRSNGQVIGNSRPEAGGSTAIVIQRLLPGRLRVQAGERSMTIKVVDPAAAAADEGGDEQGNTADLLITITARGLKVQPRSIPAFLALSVEVRNELPAEASVSLKTKEITAVADVPKGGTTVTPLEGLKPGTLRVRAAALKAKVRIRR